MVTPHQVSDKFLESLSIFRDLTPAQLAGVREVLYAKSVSAGYTLITENQPGELVYIIAGGSTKVCSTDDYYNEIVIALRGVGEVVGEMSVLDGQGRSASIVTLEPSLLMWVSRNDFWSVLWEMPPIPYNLTFMLAQRVRSLTAQLQAMGSLDVQGRLARQLIYLSDEFGRPQADGPPGATVIPFFLNQKELASMIGATREQVNKHLNDGEKPERASDDSSRDLEVMQLLAFGQNSPVATSNSFV